MSYTLFFHKNSKKQQKELVSSKYFRDRLQISLQVLSEFKRIN